MYKNPWYEITLSQFLSAQYSFVSHKHSIVQHITSFRGPETRGQKKQGCLHQSQFQMMTIQPWHLIPDGPPQPLETASPPHKVLEDERGGDPDTGRDWTSVLQQNKDSARKQIQSETFTEDALLKHLCLWVKLHALYRSHLLGSHRTVLMSMHHPGPHSLISFPRRAWQDYVAGLSPDPALI